MHHSLYQVIWHDRYSLLPLSVVRALTRIFVPVEFADLISFFSWATSWAHLGPVRSGPVRLARVFGEHCRCIYVGTWKPISNPKYPLLSYPILSSTLLFYLILNMLRVGAISWLPSPLLHLQQQFFFHLFSFLLFFLSDASPLTHIFPSPHIYCQIGALKNIRECDTRHSIA